MSNELAGKDTTCHQCKGPAVWVANSHAVGSYHYCRACKIETGPFARIDLPKLEDPVHMNLDEAIRAIEAWQQQEFFFTDDLDQAVDYLCRNHGDCEVHDGAD